MAFVFVFAFAFTNGVHDASNAIATLVATRAASPGQAMLLAAVFNTLGPLLVGAAVADTIGGIVAIDGRAAVEVIGAGLVAAVAWNALTWWLVTPLEPEALYALSRGSDEVLNQAKDAVRESEVMACPPDAAFAEMAAFLAEATRRLGDGIGRLGARGAWGSSRRSPARSTRRTVTASSTATSSRATS